ncbi:MAG TPA: helix-turn-helix domain-containing protein [Solirubrobacteraceae bacterium]|nr:helix-turn-helix domain-containing protein [Solirubrobacteraceae bacterium]
MPLDETTPTSPESEQSRLREVSDARTMRALAHPVRLALIETLNLAGPLTATQAGERIGESPTTCSFHLRQLAKYGFVEEAGGGSGRSRPWRLSTRGMRFSTEHGDPETNLAASTLAGMLRDRQLDRFRSWVESRGSFPQAWRDVAEQSEFVIWMTTDELKELNEELIELLVPRFRDRQTDPAARPDGALPVELLILSYPLTTSPGGQS